MTLLDDHLGYGTYQYQTNSPTDVLDIYVTYGSGFTFDDYGEVTMTQGVGAASAVDAAATCAAGYVPMGDGCSTDTAGASNWLTRIGTAPGGWLLLQDAQRQRRLGQREH